MISALRLGPRQLVHQLGPQVFDQHGHGIGDGFDARASNTRWALNRS
jgi:hypothetical protein